MAYFLNKGLAASQQEFIVETVADIAKLQTSTATCMDLFTNILDKYELEERIF